jgi:hypothetical protein
LSGNLKRFAGALAVAALLLGAAGVLAAKKKNPEDALRSVHGVVSDSSDAQVTGAIVQLKNTKTLQIRSFITQDHGVYYFHGLSPDVDYEVRADYQGASSSSKTVSSFDSRKDVLLNLKLAKK